jgi:hypothetical protein
MEVREDAPNGRSKNMGHMVVVINTEGEIIAAHMPDTGTLEFLQGEVGGWIERVPFPIDGIDAWINEEGKYAPHTLPDGTVQEGLPLNTVATRLMNNARLLFPGDWIAGNMVLTRSTDEGETVGVTTADIASLDTLLRAKA